MIAHRYRRAAREPRLLRIVPRPPAGRRLYVAESFADLVPALTAHLPLDFDVQVGPPRAAGVALVPAQGLPATAFWRGNHPDTILIVIASRFRTATGDAAGYLDAGADVYLVDPGVRLMAAHVAAAARRLPDAEPPPEADSAAARAWRSDGPVTTGGPGVA